MSDYPFQMFLDDAKSRYGEPLKNGEYVGSDVARACDKNAYKHRDQYLVFRGVIVPKNRPFYDGSSLNHFFNVDKVTGEVVEFTDLDSVIQNGNVWKTDILYFGREIPANTKLKDIWKESMNKELAIDLIEGKKRKIKGPKKNKPVTIIGNFKRTFSSGIRMVCSCNEDEDDHRWSPPRPGEIPSENNDKFFPEAVSEEVWREQCGEGVDFQNNLGIVYAMKGNECVGVYRRDIRMGSFHPRLLAVLNNNR